ncbi:MAG: CAP domain-containing protein [Dehalococcoidia bacterium]|nr:CAP domain-containing protein [Dehalococcoidia bacterium]
MRLARFPLAALTGVLLVLLLASSCLFPTVSLASLTEQEVETQMYDLVNLEREKAGLLPLARDTELDRLARLYSSSRFAKSVEYSTDLFYLLRNSWWASYSSGGASLHENTAREQVDYCMEHESLREIILREDARATGLGVTVASDTAYFTQIFDVLNAAGAKGTPVKLTENPYAADPTWWELRAFLSADDTDEQAYIEGSFVCADFAAMLHNRAEEAGIRAAYVSVRLEGEPGHALNAFNTTDRGRVFIDCTGRGLNAPGAASNGDDPLSYDKVAYIAVGREYGLIGIDKAPGFEYASYEYWVQQWDDYFATLEEYKAKSREYEAAVSSGRLSPKALAQLKNEVDALKRELEELTNELGNHKWEPLGTVTGFYVHW